MARTARTTARTAPDLLDLILDPGWEEKDTGLSTTNPIGFPGYADRDPQRESVISADGALGGLAVVGIAFDFEVFGGSMGVAAGEKIARAFERAVERRAAVIALTASGGARMQEGMPALAQMAKTILARRELTAAGLPFLAYLSDPTTGGVYASFASLADVLWAEPGATIGFAGPRVAEQVAPLDDESHTAEFSLANGLVDDVVAVEDLRAAAGVFLRATFEPDDPEQPREIVDAPVRTGSPWDVVQIARHPERPSGRAIVDGISSAFVELRGDRAGVEDAGVVTGVARIGGRRCGVVALDRTRPSPPGLRKAYRSLRFAGALGVPLVTIVDTPGADPSSASEAGGIARTIATAFRTVLEHPGPSVAVVSGEGGSGAALAVSVCDRILLLENAIFSVIAPESAAAILRRDDVEEVARDLKLTAHDLVNAGIADAVIPEPTGGAHADPAAAIGIIAAAVGRALDELSALPTAERLAERRRRWRQAGNAFLA